MTARAVVAEREHRARLPIPAGSAACRGIGSPSWRSAPEPTRIEDSVEQLIRARLQGDRAQKLFATVVLAALDDAISDQRRFGNGIDAIGRWARSSDGHTVLICAGIDPTERCAERMMAFVARGIRTSAALAREHATDADRFHGPIAL